MSKFYKLYSTYYLGITTIKILILLPLLLLISCTTPTVRNTETIDKQTEQCDSVDCVIDLMDKLPQGKQEDRYVFMEGFPDANLRKLKDSGKLTVETLNPLLLSVIVFGYAYMEPNKFGGMDTCEVQYLPGFNWLFLKHELSHCQGYADHGIPLMGSDYTDFQKEIMEKEKVTRWIDTEFHKTNQDGHLNQ